MTLMFRNIWKLGKLDLRLRHYSLHLWRHPPAIANLFGNLTIFDSL